LKQQQQLTINSTEVALLAQILRPDAKRLTNGDKGCALTLLIIKKDISQTKNDGACVYSFVDVARLRHPDYDEASSRAQKAYVADIRQYILKLTNMSAETRGEAALGIAPFTEATTKLFKKVKKTGEPVTVAEVAGTYLRCKPYVGLGAFSNLNGEFVIGWDEAQRYTGQRKADIAVARAQSWKEGQIASVPAVKQLGVLSEQALDKAERASQLQLPTRHPRFLQRYEEARLAAGAL